jgi:hypothetical protein
MHVTTGVNTVQHILLVRSTKAHVHDFCLGACCGFCLSSNIEAVMPVVAMEVGRGRREGAERRRTAPGRGAPLVPDMALPGREAVFSRDIPGGRVEVGLVLWG